TAAAAGRPAGLDAPAVVRFGGGGAAAPRADARRRPLAPAGPVEEHRRAPVDQPGESGELSPAHVHVQLPRHTGCLTPLRSAAAPKLGSFYGPRADIARSERRHRVEVNN